MDLINSQTTEVLSKALDGLMMRHDAITSNMANIDTPGYKALKVEFEDKLKQAILKDDQTPNQTSKMLPIGSGISSGMLELNITHQKHFGTRPLSLASLQLSSCEDPVLRARNDNNSIDIDSEMVALSKTDMQYQAVATLQSKNLNGMSELLKSIQ